MPDRFDALDYHELTKHSVSSIHSHPHFLDWDNQPLPYKIYSSLEPIALPRDLAPSPAAATLRSLARLLHYTAGITRTKQYPNGHEHAFRAAACTGALYHIDVYVVCGDLPDLAAGVYHFAPHDFALRCLRRGDHRSLVVDASADEPATAGAPLLLLFASTFWRNAWKYQARAYRHCFWDCGTMLANLLAVAVKDEIEAKVVAGFADEPLNRLLGLDQQREAVVSYVALGKGASAAPAVAALPPLDLPTVPLSAHEVDYPAIRAAHAGSALDSPQAVRQWREHALRLPLPPASGALVNLPADSVATRSLEDTINRRGSARRFARAPIRLAALAYILRTATADLRADFIPEPSAGAALNDLYLIVNAVEGLQPGSYVYRSQSDALELLKAGDFRREAGHLDLGQELAADASVNFYALSDLEPVVANLGNRGYRAASLEAAILGGRIYLAAYALQLAATGLTFFDDDVTRFFSPSAAGRGVLFLTAVGCRHRTVSQGGG